MIERIIKSHAFPPILMLQDEDGDLRATIESLSPRDGATSSKDGAIVALAAKCSESILNPDYLLGTSGACLRWCDFNCLI